MDVVQIYAFLDNEGYFLQAAKKVKILKTIFPLIMGKMLQLKASFIDRKKA